MWCPGMSKKWQNTTTTAKVLYLAGGPKSEIMHNGVVYSMIKMKEYNKSLGTTLKDTAGNIWTVVHSKLSTYCKNDPVVEREVQGTIISTNVSLPSIDWEIIGIPR